MSRKDFELIAKVLKSTKPTLNATAWENTAQRFAQELKTTNPQFNQERFLRACGY